MPSPRSRARSPAPALPKKNCSEPLKRPAQSCSAGDMAAADRPRVFLDTNVLVSALYSAGGPPEAILRLHVDERITIVVSQLVVDELIRALRRKLPDALPLLRELLPHT